MIPNKLLTTSANFEQWRNSKLSRGSATPEHLFRQAVALLPHYSKTTIVKKLRISNTQFHRWCVAYQSHDALPQFIPLPDVTQVTESLSIELKFINGNGLTLSGELNKALLAKLIEAVK